MGLPEVPVRDPSLQDMMPEASVHGRFQPLHNAHLEYIREAKRRCKFLWIGITKYDMEHLNPLGRHRDRPEANPLTYFERTQIITDALLECQVSRSEFGFVPFPIETPTALPRFLPTDIPCVTTICEDWNREKIHLLEKCGYRVIVLWERIPKQITGGSIREDIASDGRLWRDLVPPATARAVVRLRLAERIRCALNSEST